MHSRKSLLITQQKYLSYGLIYKGEYHNEMGSYSVKSAAVVIHEMVIIEGESLSIGTDMWVDSVTTHSPYQGGWSSFETPHI